MYVIFCLGGGPLRFTEIKRAVGGISQRMLTVTLRGLERDGIVSRTMYPVMPPHVEYELTTMGHKLVGIVASFLVWADDHLVEIDAARLDYDERGGLPAVREQAPAREGVRGGP